MSRIMTNVPALVAARILEGNNKTLNTSLERLSTGYRINRGKDDPAGLIASETLRGEIAAIQAAMDNAERADMVISVAEGGLQEISNLLVELESLVDTTANEAALGSAEVEANQLQIDSILDTINRILGSQADRRQPVVHHLLCSGVGDRPGGRVRRTSARRRFHQGDRGGDPIGTDGSVGVRRDERIHQ